MSPPVIVAESSSPTPDDERKRALVSQLLDSENGRLIDVAKHLATTCFSAVGVVLALHDKWVPAAVPPSKVDDPSLAPKSARAGYSLRGHRVGGCRCDQRSCLGDGLAVPARDAALGIAWTPRVGPSPRPIKPSVLAFRSRSDGLHRPGRARARVVGAPRWVACGQGC